MNTTKDVARLGVDIGGTFTDAVLEVDGQRFTNKVLTTSVEPEQGVLEAVETIIDRAGTQPSDIGLIIHGTTLATNALIERKGAKTALITTEGFRDTLEIRLEHRFEQYDIFLDLPEPLVPRNLRFTVPERLNARGEVLIPLNEQALEILIQELKQLNIEAVAIGYLHSYVNPDHEIRTAEIIHKHLPEVAITLSSEVAPEMREYERISTACANAYLQPRMARYLIGFQQELKNRGFVCPLLLMLSGGGLTTVETSKKFPVRLVESGPAGGAIFSGYIADQCNFEEVLSFDMGGTTAKICLIDKGKPQTSQHFEVARIYRFKKGSGLPLRIPVIEMVEIGAGGGSIARVDSLNRIVVGPESAGSEPGPACYGMGGTKPTVTDANVALGRIDPNNFSGGRIMLDPEASKNTLITDVGERIQLSAEIAALGVCEIVDENMASAARVHAIESGKEASTRTLIAFGGGAPLHALRVAEKIGIKRVLIPLNAGVGSAVGFLRAPVAFEIVRSNYQLISTMNVAEMNSLLRQMSDEAKQVVEQASFGEPLFERRVALMRYFGQGHEITVEMPVRDLIEDDRDTLRKAFEDKFQHLYGRIITGAEVELLTWKFLVSTMPESPIAIHDEPGAYKPEPVQYRDVYDIGKKAFISVPIYWRPDLRPGAEIDGPAIIAENETSTVITSGYTAKINSYCYIEAIKK